MNCMAGNTLIGGRAFQDLNILEGLFGGFAGQEQVTRGPAPEAPRRTWQ